MNWNIIKGMVVLFFTVVNTGYSAVFVDFLNNWGIFTDSPGGTGLPSGALVQLIWSPDSSYSSTPVESMIPSTGQAYSGTDYVVYQNNTTEAYGWGNTTPGDFDGSASYTDSNVGGSGVTETLFSSGYLYAYIFQDGTPQAWDYYGRTSVVAVPDRSVETGSIDPCVVDTSSPGLVIGSAGQNLQVVAVPEPSTIGLLLVGAGLVAFRRMRRS
jgi:hypothetical protein